MAGINAGSTRIKQIMVGNQPVREVRVGSELVWAYNFIGDDFDRDDSDNSLGSNWTNIGPSMDRRLSVENNMCRVYMPDGIIGGSWDARLAMSRWNAGTATEDDGYVEVRPTTRGDNASFWAGGGFNAAVLGRCNASGGLTHGVGINLYAGQCYIMIAVNGNGSFVASGGAFQPGNLIRLTYTGRTFVLTVKGTTRATWTDTNMQTGLGSSYRSLVIAGSAGKDLFGPRRFSPGLDNVVMG